MTTVAILQCRMGSIRLPGKSLLPLLGVPMVQQIVERVQRASRVDRVVVAYPLADAPAFQFLADTGCSLYAYPGDESDLVGRYVLAAAAYDAEVIVRVPCDNPCIDPLYVDEAIQTYAEHPFIYYSNTTAAVGRTWVDGIGAEVLSMSRLQWLEQRTRGIPYLREHPHRYFEECGLLRLPRADVRLDVNTAEDYALIQSIYQHMGHNRFASAEVLEYLAMLSMPVSD